MLSHALPGPEIQTFLCSRKWCLLRPSLDLDVFPQMSQEWLTLVRWFASMCLLTSTSFASFPQTLHVNALNRCPFCLVMKFSDGSIIDLICSSSWSVSVV